MKKGNRKKPKLGRIPIPRPGSAHKDRSKYDRKRKHKKEKPETQNSWTSPDI
jgi:hypothetical protein